MEFDSYKSIGEVSGEVGVSQQTLRYWGEKFSQLNPIKRYRYRYYSQEDVKLIVRIRGLLRDDGYTIKGAIKAVNAGGEKLVVVTKDVDLASDGAVVDGVDMVEFRKKLLEIKALLSS